MTMDQYADSLVTVPTVMQNSLRPLSTSCIIACYLLYFMVQGKITEASWLTVHLHITRHPIWTVGAPLLSFPPFLCQMPFLSQPSQFFLSWLGTGTKLCWLAYPVAWLVLLIRDIVLMLYLLLSYGQLWAALLIGQSAVMWHSSQSNGEQFTFDIEWLNCAVLQ